MRKLEIEGWESSFTHLLKVDTRKRPPVLINVSFGHYFPGYFFNITKKNQ
jgi:hypothetical protein